MGGKVSKKNRQLLTIIGLCVLLIALIIVFFVATKHKDNSEKKEEAGNDSTIRITKRETKTPQEATVMQRRQGS